MSAHTIMRPIASRAREELTEHSPRGLPGPATIGTSRHARIHFWFTITCRILKSRTGVAKRARAFCGITSTSLVFHRFRTDHQRVSVCAVRFHHHHGALVPGSTTSTLVVNIHGRWSGSHGSPLMRQGPFRATGTPPEFAPIFLHKTCGQMDGQMIFRQRYKNLSPRSH